MTSGISAMTARPIISVLSAMPGPDVIVQADRRDLVLCLVHEATCQVEVVGQVVRRRGGGRDRVHGNELHARRHDAQADGLVAVDDDRMLEALIVRRRDLELVVETVASEGIAGIEQLVVDVDDLLALLAEDLGDFFLRNVDVAVVDATEHAQYEHVLALARIIDDLQAFLLDRQFVYH